MTEKSSEIELPQGSFTQRAALATETKYFFLQKWVILGQPHRQMGSMPNCDCNGNDTKIKCHCRRSVNELLGFGIFPLMRFVAITGSVW